MKNIFYFGLIGLVLLTGCPKPEPIEEPKIITKDDINLCDPVCAVAEPLGCPEFQALERKDLGVCAVDEDCVFEGQREGFCVEGTCIETCVMVCEAAVNLGVQLGLECILEITKCEQIESECR